MSTVRRLYFYSLASIGAEVVIWGVIGLLRTALSDGLSEGSLLAAGLSLVIVGLPVFLLHWRVLQRDALRETEERSSRIRPIFLYGLMLATLWPVVFAVMALLDRALVVLFGLPVGAAWFGGEGTALDNLVSIAINGLAAWFFWHSLQADWKSGTPDNSLHETRRLYRYLWMLTGLTISVAAVYNLLRYFLFLPSQQPDLSLPYLAAAVTLALIGVPLLVYHWGRIQDSLIDPEERSSLLRLVILYLISLAGIIGLLAAAGAVLSAAIRLLLGEEQSLVGFLQSNSVEIAAAIPLGVMWVYFGRILTREVGANPDQPRREGLRRLYGYILSLLGLALTYAGLVTLSEYLGRVIFQFALPELQRSLLGGALSSLIMGLPLWLLPWREMNALVARQDDAGDRARRSVVRRAYLYLVLFLFMIGVMVFAGQVLYTLLDALLTQLVPEDLGSTITGMVLALTGTAGLLVYHWRVLRRDGLVAQQFLGKLHAEFPTLVIVEEDQALADALVHALARSAPRLPVAVKMIEQGTPDEVLLEAKAVIIPLHLALDPPEPLRLWLADYHGRRIVLPVPKEGWFWVGQAQKNRTDMAREAARAVRHLSEGESVRPSVPASPWAVAGYLLGGLFGLQLLTAALLVIISFLFR